MRAYRDTTSSMAMISSVGDHRHEVKPETSVIIICENPADTDLLFDFLTANTNIIDKRTKDGHPTIDVVERGLKARVPATNDRFSIREMETELLNRWDKRINELEAIIDGQSAAVGKSVKRIGELLQEKAQQKEHIDDLKSDLESMESTKEWLLRACDKRLGLLVGIQKDMANGVPYTRIERELNTALEEL